MKIYDSDIRKLLIDKFFTTKAFISDTTTKVIHEMDVCTGTSRIDIAVINGKINGYEIKSEQDTLERLPSQIESYNKVFDTVTIVTGEKYIDKVTNIVPEWWGIYCVTSQKDRLTLKRKRQNKINKSIDILQVTQLLWRDELLKILALHDIQKGTKSKTRFALSEMVVNNIDPQIIKDFVRQALKNRTTWRADLLQQLYDDSQQ
ncbi:MAG: sce7726 family protein [Aminipila sp.]